MNLLDLHVHLMNDLKYIHHVHVVLNKPLVQRHCLHKQVVSLAGACSCWIVAFSGTILSVEITGRWWSLVLGFRSAVAMPSLSKQMSNFLWNTAFSVLHAMFQKFYYFLTCGLLPFELLQAQTVLQIEVGATFRLFNIEMKMVDCVILEQRW